MKKIRTIFLLGQYGSGKDTHGNFIAEKFGLTHLIFSQFLSQDSVACKYIQRKKLVPDQDVFRILGSYSLDGYLFNGFPRTLPQMEFILKRCQIDQIAIVYLDVVDEIAIHRMENRLVCSQCKQTSSKLKGYTIGDHCKDLNCKGILEQRFDDTPDGIVERTATFRTTTLPIIQEAEKSGVKIFKISITKEQPIETTRDMIMHVIG